MEILYSFKPTLSSAYKHLMLEIPNDMKVNVLNINCSVG